MPRLKSIRPNPLKTDPTRTGMQRRALQRDFNRRFNRLKREITQLIVEDDVFGLRQPEGLTFNEELTLAHLPGKHVQKSHGRRGPAVVPDGIDPDVKLTELQEELYDQMRDSGVFADMVKAIYDPDDPQDQINTALDLESGVSMKDIHALRSAVYKDTQSWLKKRGVEGDFTLFRGDSKKRDPKEFLSFTTQEHTAKFFARSGEKGRGRTPEGLVTSYVVDSRMIRATSNLTIGTFAESEFIVQGTDIKQSSSYVVGNQLVINAELASTQVDIEDDVFGLRQSQQGLTLAHLPGKHVQKSHGRKGRQSAPIKDFTKSEIDERVEKADKNAKLKKILGRSVVKHSVHHATSEEFDRFEEVDQGTFFADRPRTSEFGSKVVTAYIRLENPYTGDRQDVETVMDSITESAAKKSVMSSEGFRAFSESQGRKFLSEEGAGSFKEVLADKLRASDTLSIWQNEGVVDAIKSAGFDGVATVDVFGGEREYVVFDPRDIIPVGRWDSGVTNAELTSNSELASTQVDVTDRIANGRRVLKRLQQLRDDIDSNDVLEYEDKPHITVRYGLHNPGPNRVRHIVKQYPRIRVKLGGVSIFEGDKQDVVKIDVEGADLHALHQHLGNLPNTQTHTEYRPHLTLAYVKRGTGKKYVGPSGLEGTELVFSSVRYSSAERKKTGMLTINTIWQFLTRDQQVVAFTDWLRSQIAITVLARLQRTGELTEDHWLREHIQRTYSKGMGRAFDLTKHPELQDNLDFFRGTKEQFLRQSFARPVSIERVKLLAGRAFNELEGVTNAMATQMQRTLVDGMIRGEGPRELARQLNRDVDGIGRKRSETITRTEIVRAHNEGQLDALEDLGVTDVGVQVEWQVSGVGVTRKGNVSPCRLCEPLSKMVITTKEAHGMLPRHPNCMCSWIPANVGESDKTQKKTQSRIKQAISRSISAERPKKKKRSLEQQRRLSRWAGKSKRIAKKRPESIV